MLLIKKSPRLFTAMHKQHFLNFLIGITFIARYLLFISELKFKALLLDFAFLCVFKSVAKKHKFEATYIGSYLV